MANRIYQAPQINLSRSKTARPFFVNRDAFFEFSFWMSAQLNELVEKHQSETRIRNLNRAIDKAGKIKAK